MVTGIDDNDRHYVTTAAIAGFQITSLSDQVDGFERVRDLFNVVAVITSACGVSEY